MFSHWEGDMFMEQAVTVHFDDDPVRFTPEGKVSVLDAIGALTQSGHPALVWECLKEEHPEILDHCENYRFQKGQRLPVVDKEGLEMLWMLLIDYLGRPRKDGVYDAKPCRESLW
jgi:hypothetical protein